MNGIFSIEYSKDEVEALQRSVLRNAHLWQGLREFFASRVGKTRLYEIYDLWGPMAQEVMEGVDVVKKHFPELP